MIYRVSGLKSSLCQLFSWYPEVLTLGNNLPFLQTLAESSQYKRSMTTHCILAKSDKPPKLKYLYMTFSPG